MSYVHNVKGKQLAIVNGFRFYVRAKAKATTNWQCSMAGRCKARFTALSTGSRQVLRANLEHNQKRPFLSIIDGVCLSYALTSFDLTWIVSMCKILQLIF